MSPQRRRLLLAAALLIGALGAGVYYAFRPDPPQPPTVEVPAGDTQLVKAVADARGAVEQNPKSAEAWGKYGMVLNAHLYVDESLICFEEAERLDSSDRRWPYHVGLVLHGRDPATAVPKYRRSLELGRSESARLRLAETLMTLGQFDEAHPEFQEIVRTAPGHPRARLGLARVALDRSELAECETQLAAAADDSRVKKALTEALIELRYRQGNMAEAEAARQRVASLPKDPPWPDPDVEAIGKLRTGTTVRSQMAGQLVDAGRYVEAERLLRELLHTNSDTAKHRLLLGYTLIQKRDYAGAEEVMAEVVRDRAEAPRAHLYLGIARFNRGRHADAIESFRKAVELKPDYTAAHANLGTCLKDSGDRHGAAKAFRAAIDTQPLNPDLYVMLAEVLILEGRKAEAADALKEALSVHPGHQKAKEQLATLK